MRSSEFYSLIRLFFLLFAILAMTIVSVGMSNLLYIIDVEVFQLDPALYSYGFAVRAPCMLTCLSGYFHIVVDHTSLKVYYWTSFLHLLCAVACTFLASSSAGMLVNFFIFF